MSLRRNLKTYLIAAVLLLMGGLAVGTVATASQPDSYLTIQKKWKGFEDADEKTKKLLDKETVTVKIEYYELNENGERISDLKEELAEIGKDGNRSVGDWSWGWHLTEYVNYKNRDYPIDIVSVKEIECSEEIGDYILVDTKYDWNDHIQAGNIVEIKKYESRGGHEGVRSSLITLEKDVADFKDGIDEYTYNIEGPDGYSKSVILTREEPKKVIDVNEYNFPNQSNAVGKYTITAAGGGTVHLTVSDSAEIDGAAAGEGFYAEKGSTITIRPTSAEEGKTYYYSLTSSDKEIAEGKIDGNEVKVEITESGTYKVKMTESGEASDLPEDADNLEEDEKDDTDDVSKKETDKDAPLPDDNSADEESPEEDGTTNGDNTQNDVTSEGGNTSDGSDGDDTSGKDNVNIPDESAPLTNVLPEEDTQNPENIEETPGDDSKEPVDTETPKDPTDGGSTEGKGENTPDAITNGEDNKPAETPVTPDAPEAAENPAAAAPTAEESVEVETTAFTVAYSYSNTVAGESVKNIKKTSSTMSITATIEANGDTAPENGWVYMLAGEGVETQSITLTAGENGTDLTPFITEGVLYSLSYEEGCKVSYGNLEVTITNVYKPKGAYNIVHEYYVNEVSPENFEGRSSITLATDAVGNEITAEELLTKNKVELVTSFVPNEGPSVGNTNTYEYTYKSEENAYGIGSRGGDSGSVSGNDVSADEEGIAPASETVDDTDDDKELEAVDNYTEDPKKGSAIVQEEGNEVIILKYVRTTDPDDPKEDPKDPPKKDPDDPDLPDPNDPESPPTVTITDDDVPRTYVRVWDPQKEEWVYLPEDEVPLAGRTSAKTADGMAPVFWMFMTGLSVAGVGAFHYSRKKKEE